MIQILCISSCLSVSSIQNVHRDDFMHMNFPYNELEGEKTHFPQFLVRKICVHKIIPLYILYWAYRKTGRNTKDLCINFQTDTFSKIEEHKNNLFINKYKMTYIKKLYFKIIFPPKCSFLLLKVTAST